jgi:hypothetical protein
MPRSPYAYPDSLRDLTTTLRSLDSKHFNEVTAEHPKHQDAGAEAENAVADSISKATDTLDVSVSRHTGLLSNDPSRLSWGGIASPGSPSLHLIRQYAYAATRAVHATEDLNERV